jgi:hypothetical protein
VTHDFFDEREVTARKAHRCEEASPRACRRTADIQPGTRYVRITGSYEGMFYSVAMCLRCRRLMKKVYRRFNPDHDEGPSFGELREWLREARRW